MSTTADPSTAVPQRAAHSTTTAATGAASTDPSPPGLKVCKFGGTSLADAAAFRRVQTIVSADPGRRVLVASAPGKRHDADRKITDLLFLCQRHTANELPFASVFERVAERFRELAAELDLPGALDASLADTERALAGGTSAAFAASRGEYLSARLLAGLLDAQFVDAAEVVRFDDRGRYDAAATEQCLRETLPASGQVVVPGFYGSRPDGTVVTFPRGGSDITGAIVAAAMQATIYENWSDVPGLLMADPAIVEDPLPIDTLTYRELRELTYMGARVLHDEAIFPVLEVGIPVNIRSTMQPDHPGTRIVEDEPTSIIVPEGERLKRIDHVERITEQNAATPVIRPVITGIAGRRDFTVITLGKALMNKQRGFGRRVLEVVDDYDLSWEHLPSGIDTLSLVVESERIADRLDDLVADLESACKPDNIEVATDMALIATVGRGMLDTPGISGRLFAALGNAGVNVRMIDQGSGELNIIVGVHVEQFEDAVRAIYGCFVHPGDGRHLRTSTSRSPVVIMSQPSSVTTTVSDTNESP